jgi:nitrate reductase molybdenum cofactor assembly chaperone NarJ/NarW
MSASEIVPAGNERSRLLKALAALLAYPTAELIAALTEIGSAIASDRRLGRGAKQGLQRLIDSLRAPDPLEAEERYVALFDRGRRTSLHLFEHVHGDSRDRGQAMVDLQQMYARGGLRLAGSELPDYLPAVLEYLSTRPMPEVREMLDDCAHILRAIGEALADRESAYAAVFAALLEVAGAKGLAAGKSRREPQAEEKSLDEEWAEEPVVFGPAAAPSCSVPAPGMRSPGAAPPGASGAHAQSRIPSSGVPPRRA